MNKLLNAEQPLWLPNGSIRAIAALGGLVVAAVLVYKEIDVPAWYLVLLTGIVKDYFRLRDGT